VMLSRTEVQRCAWRSRSSQPLTNEYCSQSERQFSVIGPCPLNALGVSR
jgi:hypothetical protein